jgi:hypothetical protein
MIEVIDDDDGGHYYAVDGHRVPGVSEILSLNDVLLKNSFYEERRERAAIRGTSVHVACADLDRGEPDWWTEDPEIAGYVKAWQKFKKDFHVRITAIEVPMYHEIYRYCGTPDRFGFVTLRDGHEYDATLDIKCVSKIGPHTELQLAGYNLFSDNHEDRIPVAVQLKPDGKYQGHWYGKDRAHNEAVFLACLSLAMWKNKHHSLGLYR